MPKNYSDIINATKFRPYNPDRSKTDVNLLRRSAMKAIELMLDPYIKEQFNISSPSLVDLERFKESYVIIDDVSDKKLNQFKNDCTVADFRKRANAKILYKPVKTYSNLLRNGWKNRDSRVAMRFLIGCPGVGKSSFVRYFKDVETEHLKDEGLNICCDFTPFPREPCPDKELSSLSAINLNLDERSEIEDKILYSVEYSCGVTIGTGKSIYERVDKILSSLGETCLVHFIDDIDQIDDFDKEILIIRSVFRIYRTFIDRRKSSGHPQKMPPIYFIVTMRKNTFNRIYRTGILDMEPAERDLLPPPPLQCVIDHRLENILKNIIDDYNSESLVESRLTHEDLDANIDELLGGDRVKTFNIAGKYFGKYIKANISILNAANIFMDIIDLLDRSAEEFLYYLTLGNIRTQIILFNYMLKSISFSEARIIRHLINEILNINKISNIKVKHSVSPKISRHLLLRALGEIHPESQGLLDAKCHDNIFFNIPRSHIEKNEWWLRERHWAHYLVKIRILQLLQLNKPGITIKSLQMKLRKLGYTEEKVLNALISMSKNRLLEESDDMARVSFSNASDQVVHISSGGNYTLEKLIFEMSYSDYWLHEIPTNFNPDDIRKNNIFLPPIRFLELFKTIEESEKKAVLMLGPESVKFYNDIVETSLWKRMFEAYTITMDKIIKVLINDKASSKEGNKSYEHIINKAEIAKMRLDNVPDYVVCEFDYVDPEFHLPDICHDCLQDICLKNDVIDTYKNPYTDKPFRLQYINSLRENGVQSTIGAEMFYSHVPKKEDCNTNISPPSSKCYNNGFGCSAGTILRLLNKFSNQYPDIGCSGTLDRVFLNNMVVHIDDIAECENLDFVTVNISNEVFENTYLLERKILPIFSLSDKAYLELPDSRKNDKNFINSLSTSTSSSVGDKRILIDDIGGKKSTTQWLVDTQISDNGHRKHVFARKIDYKVFQRHINGGYTVPFSMKLYKICEEARKFNQYVIVEGIQEKSHLKFMENFVDEYCFDNVLMQGFRIKKV